MSPRRRGQLIGGAVAVGFLLALAGVLFGLAASWGTAGDVEISIHGWIAMALAFSFTGLIGGGLMWLAFYSHRRGWDDIDRDA